MSVASSSLAGWLCCVKTVNNQIKITRNKLSAQWFSSRQQPGRELGAALIHNHVVRRTSCLLDKLPFNLLHGALCRSCNRRDLQFWVHSSNSADSSRETRGEGIWEPFVSRRRANETCSVHLLQVVKEKKSRKGRTRRSRAMYTKLIYGLLSVWENCLIAYRLAFFCWWMSKLLKIANKS